MQSSGDCVVEPRSRDANIATLQIFVPSCVLWRCFRAYLSYRSNWIRARGIKSCKFQFSLSIPYLLSMYSFYFISSHDDTYFQMSVNILFQETNFKEPTKVFNDTELDQMNMKYYNDQVHRAAFILPRFITKALDKSLAKN